MDLETHDFRCPRKLNQWDQMMTCPVIKEQKRRMKVKIEEARRLLYDKLLLISIYEKKKQQLEKDIYFLKIRKKLLDK